MNIDVSIIVPIYNAEKHLARCIESVLKQNFKNFELILMNDGSTDSSEAICNEYALKDSRVLVVNKENSGVSDTRNQAIKLAKGKYLQFIDSDDWISSDATELLYKTAEENACEMVIADFYRVVGNRLSQKGRIRVKGVVSKEEFAIEMMENPADFYYGVLWNKIYRKDIIEKNSIYMDKDISWCEDFIFNMEYIRRINNVYVLHVPIYYYVKTPNSLVSQGSSVSKTVKMKQTVFKYYKEFYKEIFEEEDYNKIQLQVYRFLFDAAGDGLVGPAILPGSMKIGNERINIEATIAKSSNIFSNNYKELKLFDKYLETIALKHNLLLDDVKVLYCLSQLSDIYKTKEMSEILYISKKRISSSIQKLISKKYIKLNKKEKKYYILENNDEIMNDLNNVNKSYEDSIYEEITKEEIAQYKKIQEIIKNNIKKEFE